MATPFISPRPSSTRTAFGEPPTGHRTGFSWDGPVAMRRGATATTTMDGPRRSICTPSVGTSGSFSMTRDEAIAILDLPREEAVAVVLALAEKAEKYDL